MSRRHWFRGKSRRRVAEQALPPPRAPVDVIPPAATPSPESAVSPDALIEPTLDDIEIPRAAEEGEPVDLDRLAPDAALREAGLREPPSLIVEGPEGAMRRRARDERDGIATADPRRGMLYVGIAVFVAALVFAVLSLIESR